MTQKELRTIARAHIAAFLQGKDKGHEASTAASIAVQALHAPKIEGEE